MTLEKQNVIFLWEEKVIQDTLFTDELNHKFNILQFITI